VFRETEDNPNFALELYGPRATLVWGYRPVATLTHWRIIKARNWVLMATFDAADRWQCLQAAKYRELHLTYPRKGYRSCWEVRDISLAGSELRAVLGPPLQ
jgi:hypothetical protein